MRLRGIFLMSRPPLLTEEGNISHASQFNRFNRRYSSCPRSLEGLILFWNGRRHHQGPASNLRKALSRLLMRYQARDRQFWLTAVAVFALIAMSNYAPLFIGKIPF